MADGIPTSSASLGSKPASLLLAPASAGPAQAASPPLASHFLPPSLAKKAKAQPAKPPGEPHLPLLLPYSKPSDFSGSPWSRKPSCPRPERGSRRRSRPPRDGNGVGWAGRAAPSHGGISQAGVWLWFEPNTCPGAWGAFAPHPLDTAPPNLQLNPESSCMQTPKNETNPPANGRQDTSRWLLACAEEALEFFFWNSSGGS